MMMLCLNPTLQLIPLRPPPNTPTPLPPPEASWLNKRRGKGQLCLCLSRLVCACGCRRDRAGLQPRLLRGRSTAGSDRDGGWKYECPGRKDTGKLLVPTFPRCTTHVGPPAPSTRDRRQPEPRQPPRIPVPLPRGAMGTASFSVCPNMKRENADYSYQCNGPYEWLTHLLPCLSLSPAMPGAQLSLKCHWIQWIRL